MADYLDGLRSMFGLQPGQSLRGRQLEQQEQQIVNPQLRDAAVQPAVAPGIPAAPMDANQQAELERQERERALQEALERIRNRQY